MRKPLIEFKLIETHDETADIAGWQEPPSDDETEFKALYEKEVKAYNNDEWHFIGVQAKAIIKFPHGTNPDCWITTTLKSPGLWGMESNCDQAYKQEVFEEEKTTLIELLKSLKNLDYDSLETPKKSNYRRVPEEAN